MSARFLTAFVSCNNWPAPDHPLDGCPSNRLTKARAASYTENNSVASANFAALRVKSRQGQRGDVLAYFFALAARSIAPPSAARVLAAVPIPTSSKPLRRRYSGVLVRFLAPAPGTHKLSGD